MKFDAVKMVRGIRDSLHKQTKKMKTKELIEFRIKQAGYASAMPLFNDEAISEIYNGTRGYPRRITMLCHQTLKELIMQNKKVVDRELVRDVIAKEKINLANGITINKEVTSQAIKEKTF